MGTFDYLKVPVSMLPETDVPPPGDVFQTKDTPDQYLIVYTITPDGKLMEGIVDTQFHGEIEFYTGNHPDVGWWEYRARFTDGVLSRITLLEFRAPEGRDRNAEIEAARRMGKAAAND